MCPIIQFGAFCTHIYHINYLCSQCVYRKQIADWTKVYCAQTTLNMPGTARLRPAGPSRGGGKKAKPSNIQWMDRKTSFPSAFALSVVYVRKQPQCNGTG